MMRRSWGFSVAVALAAVALCASPALVAAQQRPQTAAGQTMPTPRTPDGHADFSGMWGGIIPPAFAAAFAGAVDEKGNSQVHLPARTQGSALGTAKGQGLTNFERDSSLEQRAHANKPIYKPEFWDRVQYLDLNGNAEDPEFNCLPSGVPRMGVPQKIVQTPTELIMIYGLRMVRIVPIDGRPIPPEDTWEGFWNGRSVGHWEGDTLVIDTVDFNDQTWLGWPGYFHSADMRVRETLRREGNTLTWQATVLDPVVLMKPWVWEPRAVPLNPDPKLEIREEYPCSEQDLAHIVTRERG